MKNSLKLSFTFCTSTKITMKALRKKSTNSTKMKKEKFNPFRSPKLPITREKEKIRKKTR